jgi:hypothetical protein
MRRILLTLLTVLAVAGGLISAPIASAAPDVSAVHQVVTPEVHSDTLCSASQNACEEVVNVQMGSDYVYFVEVWDNNDTSFNGTYRLLFNGSVRYTGTGTGPVVFNLDYNVNSGVCIQGGIIGISDARTPCWNAP